MASSCGGGRASVITQTDLLVLWVFSFARLGAIGRSAPDVWRRPLAVQPQIHTLPIGLGIVQQEGRGHQECKRDAWDGELTGGQRGEKELNCGKLSSCPRYSSGCQRGRLAASDISRTKGLSVCTPRELSLYQKTVTQAVLTCRPHQTGRLPHSPRLLSHLLKRGSIGVISSNDAGVPHK